MRLLFIIFLAISLPALADDAEQIVDTPIAVPEVVLKKLDTLKLKESAGVAVVRYMAVQDAGLIRQWLRSEGYLDAQVAAKVEDGKAQWLVHAGELWRVRHVEASPTPLDRVTLPQSGDVFVSENYEKLKGALLWSWRDAGYLKAGFIKAAVIPDAQTRQVDIVWHVQTGPLFYISDIHVEGDGQYAPELAVKMSRLQPGQEVTQQRLQDAMQHISEDSRYQHAMIVPQLKDAVGDRVPLNIKVSESGWRKLTGDVGYSTDSGFGLGAAWVDRSLLQGNIEYSLRGETSRTASGVGATLLRPVWPAHQQQIGFDVDYYRSDTDGRRYDSVSGGPFWQLNFLRKDYLRISLHAENIREAGVGLLTLGPSIDVHLAHEYGGLIPVRGWRMDAGVGLPMRLNSQGLWTVINISGRYFYRPLDWLLFSPRAGFGRTINLQGSVPKTYRQFAGGATSIRGYALDSLGPLDAGGLATGGLMKTFAGLDLVLMPDDQFSPVLFGDGAKVWQTVGSSGPIVWSAGVGLIMQTPAGPLRLDFAMPLNRRLQDDRFQFYLTLGDVF